MKRLLCISVLFVSCVLAFTACKKDDNNTNNNTSAGAPGAGWHVSLYTEPGEDKTQDYTGYTFNFAEDGTLTATHTDQNTAGTWRQHQDDGVTKLEIAFTTSNENLEDLNHDWVLVSRSNTFISLKDDNDSKNELLQFSK